MSKQKREVIYDYIRVLSCIFVIGIHSTENLYINSIFRIGLPMFILLSGVLILNGKEEPVSEFYFKRFLKVVVPLYFYSIIYLFIYKYNCDLKIFMPINFFKELANITKGYVHYHLWYAYMIIGIYIFAPYLRKMCNSLKDKDCKNLLILIFIISFIKYTLPEFNINIGISDLAFSGCGLIFLLGYLVTKPVINKHYKTLYILGIISFNINIFIKTLFPHVENLYDVSVTMMLQVIALFIFLYRNKDKICSNKTINKVIIHISKYTWELFLIHVIVLDILKQYILKLNIPTAISTTILILLVAIISYFYSVIIHNFITKPIQTIIEKLYITIKKNVAKISKKI